MSQIGEYWNMVNGRRSQVHLLFGVAIAFTVIVAAAAVLRLGTADASSLDRSFGHHGLASTPAYGTGGLFPHALVEDSSKRIVAAIGGDGDWGGFGVVRYLRNGRLDKTFAEAGKYEPDVRGELWVGEDLVVENSNRIVVAGWQHRGRGTAPILLGLTPKGELDPSFASNGVIAPEPHLGGMTLRGLALDPAGRLVAVGAMNEHRGSGSPKGVVLRYREDGRLDRSFGKNGKITMPSRRHGFFYSGLDDVAVIGRGQILVAGYRHGDLYAERLTASGKRDQAIRPQRQRHLEKESESRL